MTNEKLEPLLLRKEGDLGRTAKDNRLFVEAVLYRYKAGCIPWRDLSEKFGYFRVIHTCYSRWAEKGIWTKIFKLLKLKHIYKWRHLVENLFCKLKEYRAIATRHDKTAQNFLAAVYLVSCVIWLG